METGGVIPVRLFEFGGYQLDPRTRLLLRDGEPVPLTPKVFDTLHVLVAHAGRVLDKEELIREVWNGAAVEEIGLTKNISTLRKALGETPDSHRFVVTIPGRGYQFVAPVTVVKEGPVQAATPPMETVLSVPMGLRAGPAVGARGRMAAAVVLLVLAGAYVLYRQAGVKDPGPRKVLLAAFENRTGDPVFDLTLRQGLAVQLDQSPYLDVVPDSRLQATLRRMGRSAETPVTAGIAREAALRNEAGAIINGSIAALGSHYVISLEAVEPKLGETIVRAQAEAKDRESVLAELARATAELRRRLGESLPPRAETTKLVDRTTSSLEALRAYSIGYQERVSGRFASAEKWYQRAIEIDPEFVSAYAGLAILARNRGERGLAAEYSAKAYQMRDRVGPRERLAIESQYHGLVTGDAVKHIEALRLHLGTFPSNGANHSNLANTYASIGRFEEAVAEARRAIALDANVAIRYVTLVHALIRLNRFEEATAALTEAHQRKLDTARSHGQLFQIAFVKQDEPAMAAQAEWAEAHGAFHDALSWQRGVAAYRGEWKKSSTLAWRGIEAAKAKGAVGAAAELAARSALDGAAFGRCTEAGSMAAAALELERSVHWLARSALAVAMCGGKAGDARPLAEELAKEFPANTIAIGVWLPAIRAASNLARGRAQEAIDNLQPAKPYDPAGELWPQYLRGRAHVEAGSPAAAAREFESILGHRGFDPASPLYVLARRELARILARKGDSAGARKHYAALQRDWQNADADLPCNLEVRKELALLR